MERQPVSSSNLKSVGYDPRSRTLEIEFHNGGVY
jgi:KTSC domain